MWLMCEIIKIIERVTFWNEMPSSWTKQTQSWNAGMKAGIAGKQDSLRRDV